MPSVGTFIAQPKSKKLVNTQDDNNGIEQGPHIIAQSDLDSWYATYSNSITKVTDSVYVVTGNFVSIVSNLNHQDYVVGRKTVVDMGKTIYIGNSTNAELLVLQKIQNFGLSTNGGLCGDVGYVVVENNCSDLGTTAGRFMVRVARV
jgi:hypothetical protein